LVADSHHFDKEQDLDPDAQGKAGYGTDFSENRIRLRSKVMRIRNPAYDKVPTKYGILKRPVKRSCVLKYNHLSSALQVDTVQVQP
jgi:hypothetical protein